MAISGVEVALFRAYLTSTGRTEHSYWGGKTRSIETDITIPLADDVDFIRRWIRYCFRKGFSVFKLKVSGDVERDKEMLSLVYRELTENLKDFTLRLDGNQGFSVKTYAQFTEVIRKAGYAIELFEQPLPKDDVRGLKVVKLFSPFPVILDETVITGNDAQQVAGENLAHGINIKIAKSGISESMAILRVAQERGLKLMIGCMTETMIGLSAAIYLATGCAAFDYIDLDGAFFLHHKNRFNDIEIKGPRFEVLS
jgi:L-alanine-DL-glutamate epimerase-like enolase superfamily enzyme